jgi:hypothetical protein
VFLRKGEQLNKQRQYHALVIPITARIMLRRRSGQPIDFRMYEEVAEEFKLSTSLTKDIYERGGREMPWLKALLRSL